MGEIEEIECDWCERKAKKRFTLFDWSMLAGPSKVFCSNECLLAYALKRK